MVALPSVLIWSILGLDGIPSRGSWGNRSSRGFLLGLPRLPTDSQIQTDGEVICAQTLLGQKRRRREGSQQKDVLRGNISFFPSGFNHNENNGSLPFHQFFVSSAATSLTSPACGLPGWLIHLCLLSPRCPQTARPLSALCAISSLTIGSVLSMSFPYTQRKINELENDTLPPPINSSASEDNGSHSEETMKWGQFSNDSHFLLVNISLSGIYAYTSKQSSFGKHQFKQRQPTNNTRACLCTSEHTVFQF